MKYKWDAKDYQHHSPSQQEWGHELLSKLGLRGDERVLDIGCGDGRLTAEIAARASKGSVIGIDSSEDMVILSRQKYPAVKFPNLAFEIGDASNLRFNNEFDVVFSNAVLHWVIDHTPVLRGIKRSLKPGGRVLLQMGGKGNAAEIIQVMDEMIASQKWRTYFAPFSFPYAFYKPMQYRKWLHHAGLRAKRLELIPKDMVHHGKDELAGWIRTTWLPYTQRVPEEMRQEFIDEMVNKYVERHPMNGKGGIHLNMVRLEVEAELPA